MPDERHRSVVRRFPHLAGALDKVSQEFRRPSLVLAKSGRRFVHPISQLNVRTTFSVSIDQQFCQRNCLGILMIIADHPVLTVVIQDHPSVVPPDHFVWTICGHGVDGLWRVGRQERKTPHNRLEQTVAGEQLRPFGEETSKRFRFLKNQLFRQMALP